MEKIKKNFSNIIFVISIGLMLYPPTRAYFIRIIAFSPSEISVENQQTLRSYNWHLKGLNTSNIDFNTLENNVVFVNFWATWCPPCVAEMPEIQKLYTDYKDKVTFLFVTNDNWVTVAKFYDDHEYKLPTYNPLTKTPDELITKSIPTTFIINKKGKIVVKKTGAASWNSTKTRKMLDALLSE